jgi:hypothetical protein
MLDIKFIENALNNNKYSIFIRKISPEFPDEILKKFIYEYSKDKDNALQINEPFLIEKVFKYLFTFILMIYFLRYFVILIW